MEGVNRLRKKQTSTLLFRSNKHLLILIALFSLFIFFIFFFPNNNNSLAPNFLKTTQCFNFQKTQKFLTYAPHSGFSNQLSEFKNAVLMSVILNRTLVVPPVLDHHAVVLGSCPKFRVSDPKELRFNVWNHAIELIRTQRYVSMADVIDISSLVSESAVRVIDFRHFVSLFCDVDINYFCSKGSKMDDSLLEKLRQCGSVLSGHIGAINECVYAVEEDCRTTVWTYQKDVENGALDSFQPDEELKRKKKISFVRRRKDVYETLGPRSIADSATVLSFGKAYALHTIKSPFVCAQLRLLDGQFKNHRSATFQGLKQKLDSLRQKESLPIHIFVMTDLPVSNWTGTYLGDLANDSDSIKLFLLSEDDELIKRAAKKVLDEGHGWNFGAFSSDGIKNVCHRRQKLPDILLHVEETVCSCASLGFVGTAGSTIADSIEMMRKKQFCSR
ncbi:O-fucosyltransferase family protein [Artemisia annua]|uniref:O-fucosyltransferase family protein n=1 Tax=Artemisia annua TaxID=35608 RepID=A0A2U1M7G6_ARTAN|nr:O-fucosyltransferase family protein [Artemisia annua]